jgi:threonyl-tRNA synthetase
MAETALRSVLENSGLLYDAVEGEGAFYGPKIDFFVPDAIGREWQLGTVQLDFSLPESFDLEYIGQDGSSKRPVVIHRAMLGAIERFMGVLIEHYGGAFPLWLAPIQGTIIPITDRNVDYALEIKNILTKDGLRLDVDTRNERMNLKIREAQLQKIPYMLVVGDRETSEKTIAVRTRNNGNLGTMSIEQLGLLLRTEANSVHKAKTS